MPITRKILDNYPNPVFIETGTYRGDGILTAIDCGFKEIYSIEITDYYYERSQDIFRLFDNVHLIKGDSAVELSKLLKTIHSPVTFWLDAHYSGQNTGGDKSPLWDEIKAIKERGVPRDVILIDDMSDYNIKIEDNILICRL